MRWTPAFLLSLLLLPTLPAREVLAVQDPHSYSRPDEVAVKHIDLDLLVDFDSHRLIGRASLTLDRKDKAVQELWLDASELDIKSVSLSGEKPGESKTTFELGEVEPLFGQSLRIALQPDTQVVHIDYASSPSAGALQWLDPSQTAGKKHPYLFSQSQPILARTWVPCQDTPSVRFTYSAKLKVPPALLALMSAENPVALARDGVYTFKMPQPIPSYLLAIAVGDLEWKSFGPRSGVYTEPVMLAKAAYEFAETEQMIDVVEKLYGPYRWGRYDILLLPPSFPFGGMENPRLTFATPTILAGDRSLVALIAHELAHSWSGNLVTNATWEDTWLNEGFTTYVEYRVMEQMKGKDYAEMLRSLGEHTLKETLDDLGEKSPDSRLALELAGRDPDLASSDIAYEKGSLFLRTLEAQLGRERWDTFLKAYFDRNAFKPTTSEDFVAQLEAEVGGDKALLSKLKIHQWVYEPDVPSNAVYAKPTLFAKVDEVAKAWKEGKLAAGKLPTKAWSSHEWVHFLHDLDKPLSKAQMDELDQALSLSKTGNSEILFAWLEHVIASKYEAGYPALRAFLVGQGRMKFLRPLYTEMAKSPEQKKLAEDIYQEARPGYHPLAVGLVDGILGVGPAAGKS